MTRRASNFFRNREIQDTTVQYSLAHRALSHSTRTCGPGARPKGRGESEFLRPSSRPRRLCRYQGRDKESPESKIPECAKACARRSEYPEEIHPPIARGVAHARFP